jgi:hypothetical protein
MKNGDLSIVFAVQGTGGSPENRVGDQDTGIPSRTVSSGLQVPGEQKQDALGELPAALFHQNVLQMHQQ